MGNVEISDNGDIKINFYDVGWVKLPPLHKEEKVKVSYSIKTPEKTLTGDSSVTVPSGVWYVAIGYAKEDYIRKDPDGLFGDIEIKKDTVSVQPIRVA